MSLGVAFIREALDTSDNGFDDIFNRSTKNRLSWKGIFKLLKLVKSLPGNPISSHKRRLTLVIVQLRITSSSGQTRFGPSGTN